MSKITKARKEAYLKLLDDEGLEAAMWFASMPFATI